MCRAYLDDTLAAKHAEYHTACPEPEQDNVAMYYTNDVLRFLPIFEMVISRCLELGQGDIVQRLLQRYPMYARCAYCFAVLCPPLTLSLCQATPDAASARHDCLCHSAPIPRFRVV